MWETTGDRLLWISVMFFNQLFGVSFWQHPFTTEDEFASDVMIYFSKSVLLKKIQKNFSTNKLTFFFEWTIPLYQCQNSKGKKVEKQEFCRCRDHQLDSDWCSVIFDVAGEPVQRRLQPLHALLERLNHWLRKLTHKPLDSFCYTECDFKPNASRSLMTSSRQHSLKWTLWKSVGKSEEQLINV